MKYTLMTGATGLLGAYLLRDSLLAGRRMAVLVRPSKMESARQRIESSLARFEVDLGCVLPRPVVFTGNLTLPSMGLDADSLRWVRQNCDQLLHNAASLSFYHDDQTGEPERSNIDGTRHVLELCRETGIKQFHHVSTAYVCGLRTGTCLESELDLGQDFGNDYERSKVAAEKLVRSAGHLDQTTFHRPAIIIGDSRTGYTSSFHGFFTPLKVAQSLTGKQGDNEIKADVVLSALGFNGEDQKNFVPVDWVSAVITHVLGRPNLHGKTYHLVPRNRVSIKTATRVLEDALIRTADQRPALPATIATDAALNVFKEQMGVYRSYWRNDPRFDYRNTTAAAPHLPCPTIHYALLMRMSLYALKAGFGWPIPQPVIPACDHQATVTGQILRPGEGNSVGESIGLQISGPGGGQWTVEVSGGSVSRVGDGLPTGDDTVVYVNGVTCQQLKERTITIDQVLQDGAVHVELGRQQRNAPHDRAIEQMVESVLHCMLA